MKVKAILISGAGASVMSSSPLSEYNDDRDRAPQEDSISFALRIPTPFPFPLPETGEDRRGERGQQTGTSLHYVHIRRSGWLTWLATATPRKTRREVGPTFKDTHSPRRLQSLPNMQTTSIRPRRRSVESSCLLVYVAGDTDVNC